MVMMDFGEAVKNFRDLGIELNPEKVQIKVPQAKECLMAGIKYFCGDKAQWLPEYEEVAAWLSDNGGRGLLCLGSNGRGKSLICGKIIPILIDKYCHRIVSCYTAKEMNDRFGEAIGKRLLYIDDLGTESSVKVDYGERMRPFAELVDKSEQKGNLLLVSSNLSVEMIRARYGDGTIDRLKATTRLVIFNGQSMRG